MLILVTILIFAVLLYIVEVRVGSCSSVYNCELGETVAECVQTKVSQQEFFGKILPLLLVALGLPLLFTCLGLGLGCLLVALILVAGNVRRPGSFTGFTSQLPTE